MPRSAACAAAVWSVPEAPRYRGNPSLKTFPSESLWGQVVQIDVKQRWLTGQVEIGRLRGTPRTRITRMERQF